MRDLIGENVAILCAEPHRSRHVQYVEHYKLTSQARVLGFARNLNAQHCSGLEFPISLQVVPYHNRFKALIMPLEGAEVMLTVSDENWVLAASDKCRIVFGRTEAERCKVNFDSLFKGVLPSSMPPGTTFLLRWFAKTEWQSKFQLRKTL